MPLQEPTKSFKQRPQGSLGGTLSGQNLAQAGSLSDVLAALPADLGALNQIFAQSAPQAQPVPQGPGMLSTLLTSIGAGLSGQPMGAAALIGQQQSAMREAQQANEAALQQFRDQQFELALNSIQEARRRAERVGDKQEAAIQQRRENELQDRELDIAEFRAETERMRAQGGIDDDTKSQLNEELAFLLGDALTITDQLDKTLADPEQTAFSIVLPATPDRPNAVPISSIADLRRAYQTQKDDLLAAIEDPKTRQQIEKRFDNVFGMIDSRLREFERRQGIAARRPQVEERVKTAKTREKKPTRKEPTAAAAQLGARVGRAIRQRFQD